MPVARSVAVCVEVEVGCCEMGLILEHAEMDCKMTVKQLNLLLIGSRKSISN